MFTTLLAQFFIGVGSILLMSLKVIFGILIQAAFRLEGGVVTQIGQLQRIYKDSSRPCVIINRPKSMKIYFQPTHVGAHIIDRPWIPVCIVKYNHHPPQANNMPRTICTKYSVNNKYVVASVCRFNILFLFCFKMIRDISAAICLHTLSYQTRSCSTALTRSTLLDHHIVELPLPYSNTLNDLISKQDRYSMAGYVYQGMGSPYASIDLQSRMVCH